MLEGGRWSEGETEDLLLKGIDELNIEGRRAFLEVSSCMLYWELKRTMLVL